MECKECRANSWCDVCRHAFWLVSAAMGPTDKWKVDNANGVCHLASWFERAFRSHAPQLAAEKMKTAGHLMDDGDVVCFKKSVEKIVGFLANGDNGPPSWCCFIRPDDQRLFCDDFVVPMSESMILCEICPLVQAASGASPSCSQSNLRTW